MARGQRALQVQPVRASQDAGHDVAVLADACAVPPVARGLASVVLAERLRHAVLADAPPAARPVQQVPPVQPRQPRRDLPAAGSGLPACKLVELAQRSADVLIADKPLLGISRRALIPYPGIGTGRALPAMDGLARKHGESLPDRR